MKIDDIENFVGEVKSVIRNWFVNDGFTDRKLTDTPTDALQVVNKKYVDDNAGSPAGNDKDIQYNDGGVMGGSTGLRYTPTDGGTVNLGGILIFDDSSDTNDRMIFVDDQAATDTSGNPLWIESGTGNGSGYGGALIISSGQGGLTGIGGGVYLTGGAGGFTSGSGGEVTIGGGEVVGTIGDGGSLSLTAGSGGSTSGDGGGINLVLGTATSGTNGRLNISNLPTSSAGLAAGDIWIDTTDGLNILKIV